MFWWNNLSLIQYACFPAFLLLALLLKRRGWPLPTLVIVAAAVGALVAFSLSRSVLVGGPNEVALAPLSGDTFESATRILREKVQSRLHRLGAARAVHYHREIASQGEARELMRSKNLDMVVWGNAHWLHVALRETPPVALSDFSLSRSYGGLEKLKLVTSAPEVGLSYQPRNETADYIAGIAAGVLPRLNGAEQESAQVTAERELALIDAGRLVAFWTAHGHRAYPWWELGNLYARTILSRDRVDLGEVHCALAAYGRALKFLHATDLANAELRAAVLNNLGVLTAVRALEERKPKLLRRSRTMFRATGKLRKARDIYGLEVRPSAVARENLQLLKGYIPKKGHAKNQKAKRPHKRKVRSP